MKESGKDLGTCIVYTWLDGRKFSSSTESMIIQKVINAYKNNKAQIMTFMIIFNAQKTSVDI